MKIIQPHNQWVRSFSCTEGNELIPKIAHELGLKTMLVAWLGNDDEIKRKENHNSPSDEKSSFTIGSVFDTKYLWLR